MVKRILSIIVLLPPTLFLFFKGEVFHFFLVALVVFGILLHEWQNMGKMFTWPVFLLVFACGGVLLGGIYTKTPFIIPTVLVILLFILLAVPIWTRTGADQALSWVSYHYLGFSYIILPLVLILKVAALPSGNLWLLFMMSVIWTTDIGAYLFGRTFGQRKMAPRISPGKTWAGFFGGLGSGMVCGTGVAYLLALEGLSGLALLMLSAMISLSGQMGDLAASLFKRQTGVKDSGNLIPGHGGLLDRLDSMLLAAPVFSFFLVGAGILGH
ncbi:phosphatidate cytidylyltransferase [Magnetococcales bacterium HHB-1]